jgi:hypothetical protein
MHLLVRQQVLLAGQPTRKPRECAMSTDDSMTRNDDAEWIFANRRTNGT